MIANNRLSSTLSKKILANKFDEAQELINQGVHLTDNLISTAIWQGRFEAFEFLFNQGKSDQLSDYIVHSIFVNADEEDSKKFREFFIANKSNPNIEKLFSNSDYHFETFFDHVNQKLSKIQIAYINPENKISYNLELEMKAVIGIKDGINTLLKKLDQFSQFKEHLAPTTIENELMLDEIQRKALKYQDMYNNYLADRMAVKEQLNPLMKKREDLNKHIADTLKKFTSSSSSNKNKLK